MEQAAVETITTQANTLVLGPLPYIHIFGSQINTYQIVISAVLTFLAVYTLRRADVQKVSATTALDIFIVAIFFGGIGARLFHVFYEAPQFYLAHPMQVFYFWQGGFVYYAGLIAGILAGFVTVHIKKESPWLWLDFVAPVVSLGYALGRIACFLVGCCYGKVCDLPWAYPFGQVDFFTGQYTVLHRHPTQIYAVVLELVLFALVLHFEKIKKFSHRPGGLFMFWLCVHALTRIFIEVFRDDDRGFLIVGLSISTVISVCLVLASGIYFFKKPE